MSQQEIFHNKDNNRFETTVDGHVAYTEYATDDSSIDILHTIVPKEIGGRGIASKLVEATYNFGKEQGLKLKATCSYANSWLKKHI